MAFWCADRWSIERMVLFSSISNFFGS
jgi:hypothetical protein